MSDPELPEDPDMSAVPSDLQLLHGLGHGTVTVLSEDGVSRDLLVLVPGMWGHARRLEEGELPEDD